MKKIFIIFTVLILCSCAHSNSDVDKIKAIMERQIRDWNKGNIEEFMNGYWKSDSLVFIGKNGIKYGWQTTLDNYLKSYPNKSAMGQLEFDINKLEVHGNAAFMLGKWKLIREHDQPNGYFTLYWKKIKGEWRITIDHTS